MKFNQREFIIGVFLKHCVPNLEAGGGSEVLLLLVLVNTYFDVYIANLAILSELVFHETFVHRSIKTTIIIIVILSFVPNVVFDVFDVRKKDQVAQIKGMVFFNFSGFGSNGDFFRLGCQTALPSPYSRAVFMNE